MCCIQRTVSLSYPQWSRRAEPLRPQKWPLRLRSLMRPHQSNYHWSLSYLTTKQPSAQSVTLLSYLEISSTAWWWFVSYLEGWPYHVILFYSPYISDLSVGDDSQLIFSFTWISTKCWADISSWIAAHHLKLNLRKNETLCITGDASLHENVVISVRRALGLQHLTRCSISNYRSLLVLLTWIGYAGFSFTALRGSDYFFPHWLRCLFSSSSSRNWTTNCSSPVCNQTPAIGSEFSSTTYF